LLCLHPHIKQNTLKIKIRRKLISNMTSSKENDSVLTSMSCLNNGIKAMLNNNAIVAMIDRMNMARLINIFCIRLPLPLHNQPNGMIKLRCVNELIQGIVNPDTSIIIIHPPATNHL
jgi:hypothetical protein